MGMIRSLRLMHGLLDGTINAAFLETLLATGGRSGDFLQLLTIPTYTTLLANSLPAAQALIASASPSAKAKAMFLSLPAAVSIFLISPVAGPEMVKTPAALSSLLALPTFAAKIISGGLFASVIGKSASLTTAFLNVDTARRAVWDSDVALGVIRDEINALAGARSATGHVITSQYTTTSHTAATNLNAVPRRILLSYSGEYGGSFQLLTNNAKRPDSAFPVIAQEAATNQSSGGLMAKFVFPWQSLVGGSAANAANNATNVTVYVSNLPVTA